MSSSDSQNLETQAWHELEAKSLLRANAQSLAKAQESSSTGSWNDWVAKDLSQGDWVVVELPFAAYELPPSAAGFIGADLVSQWNDLVSDVCDVHNQFIGMKQSIVGAILAGDERVQGFKLRSRSWVDLYIDRRVKKTVAKTGGSTNQFQLLISELLPKIEEIAYREGSANKWLMGEFTDYLPAQLLNSTCRSLLDTKFDQRTLSTAYRILSRDPVEQHYLAELSSLYQWHHFDDLPNILAMVKGLKPDQDQGLNADQIRVRLQELVDDIQEMRPFLRHNYRPENIVVEVVPGLVISFRWAVGLGVGFIPVAPSTDEMLKHHHRSTGTVSMTIGYDGILSNLSSPWIDSNSLLKDLPEALLCNLWLLEIVHSRLLELYSKIDIDAVLRRFRIRNSEVPLSPVVEASEEEFAALCQLISEPSDIQSSSTGSRAFQGIGGIRVQRLLSILADKLGCEVRQGKGSEIVIYREGGHHFRLGHHKRNPCVPPFLIRSLLFRVGVSLDEWIGAVGA